MKIKMRVLRRTALAVIRSALFVSVMGVAQGQSGEPECIAPTGPGGGYELTCRLAAEGLLKTGLIDERMIVRYMPGGIGAVAYNHVVGMRSSDPNLIVAASTGAAVNLALGKFGEYGVDDVRWLGALGVDYGVVVVPADSPWDSLDQLMKDLKANPSEVVIGGSGTVGSQDWMKAALLAKSVGVDPENLRYVAFEGGGPALAALLGHHIEVATTDVAELKGRLKNGKLRVLALLSKGRLGQGFSEIPTAREQGYDVVWEIWRGWYMGPNVSDAVYQKWVTRLKKLADSPEFAKLRTARGLFPLARIGKSFDKYVTQQVHQFEQLAAEVGLVK